MLSPASTTSKSTSPPVVRVGRKNIPVVENQPEISVEKTGEVITQITIKCGCGQEIKIDCQYQPINQEAQ